MGLGNLDNFLTEKDKIVDFSWLDINPDDYNNVPFDDTPEYIAIPKLQEAWRHLEDSNINLVPNSDLNYNYKTPQPAEQDILEVLNFSKKQMMTGKKGKDLANLISDYASPEIIKVAYQYLAALKDEYGLLGTVYIDPTVFAKCSEGAKFLKKRAKTARYVKKMGKCGGCVFNDCGRCQVYKRNIASEIPYGPELFSFYAKHFNLNGSKTEINSISDLKKAFLEEDEKKVKYAENKPVDKTPEKTLKEKTDQYKDELDNLKKELSKVFSSKISYDISALLMKGYDAHIVKKHIMSKYSKKELNESKEIIAEVLSQQGSLGTIYIDDKNIPYESCFDAKDYVKQNAPKAKYFITTKNFCKCFPKDKGWGQTCRNTNKIIVPNREKIPHNEWAEQLNTFPKDMIEKVSSIFKVDKVKAIRLAYLQTQLLKTDKGSSDYNTFQLKSDLDQTSYTPKGSKVISFNSQKIIAALNKGYPLSSIIGTGTNLGISKKDILVNVKKALNKVGSINKYQFDISMEMPKGITLVSNQKDLNIEMRKPLSEVPDFATHSSEAPVDNIVKDIELKDAEICLEDIDKKSSEIEITGLGEYTIG